MRHHRANHWPIRKISIFYDVFTISIPNTQHISHIVDHLSSKYLHTTFSISIIRIVKHKHLRHFHSPPPPQSLTLTPIAIRSQLSFGTACEFVPSSPNTLFDWNKKFGVRTTFIKLMDELLKLLHLATHSFLVCNFNVP